MLSLSSFLTKTQNSRKNRNIKRAVSGLRQFLATESSLKWRKIISISPQKLFSFSRYLSFYLDFLVMYRKGLIKKIKVNFKFYDVTAWLTSSFNTHIAQYEILRCLILFLVIACNNSPFRAFVTMIYWTSIKVLLNLLAPLYSAVPSLDFEQTNVFWTSIFDSVSIVFDSLSVSRSLPGLHFSMALIPLALHSFPLWFAQFQSKAP